MSQDRNARNNYSVSIKGLAEELMPGWGPDEWFHWPPDLFALTSVILKTTGIYRYVVSKHPETGQRLNCDWGCTEENIKKTSREIKAWYGWFLGVADEMPELLRQCRDVLFDERNVIDPDGRELSSEVCTKILHLHALADTACANFGFPSGSNNPVYLLANFFLEMTGTLSRLPKRHGIVLPKMRAPQKGLTLRSFSHNITFHQSEVSVTWRTIPWVNQNYNTVNIMLIPVPYQVSSQSFRQCNYPSQNDAKGFKYFEYTSEEKLDANSIVSQLKKAQAEVDRVHMLVFPELALSKADLARLKSVLAREIKPHLIPLIISGLRVESGNHNCENQVVLSVFFAGKWYDLGQSKHHRWKLDANQLQQYSLAGGLNIRSQWWEGIEIPRRNLTFICPNGWLTLCPLICEDLAQLEPVSDLIRGVGPTIVIALLMDGPQLPERWPARYVGVLADDPGTSVLTLTSLGMARRSRAKGKGENRTVALWKDKENGWEQLELKEGAESILLTVTADWDEEFTADGRSDQGNAASFILRGVHLLKADEGGGRARGGNGRDGSRSKLAITESTDADARELSVLAYLAAAIINAPVTYIDEFRRCVLIRKGEGDMFSNRFRFFPVLLERIELASHRDFDPDGEKTWPMDEFVHGVEQLCDLIREANSNLRTPDDVRKESAGSSELRVKRLEQLVKLAEDRLLQVPDAALTSKAAGAVRAGSPFHGLGGERTLSEMELALMNIRRLNNLVYLSILWAIYNLIKETLKDLDELSGANAADYRLMKEIEKRLNGYDAPQVIR